MTSYLLAFDCSFDSAVLALLDLEQFQPFIKGKIEKQESTKEKLKQKAEFAKASQKREPSKKEFLSSFSLQPFDIKGNHIKTIPGFIEKKWDSSLGSPSDQLPLKIKKVFEEALLKNSTDPNLKISRLNLKKTLKGIAVGVGPGRFTGIRTALSVAKSLAYSLQTPLGPINSLQLIAESYFEDLSFPVNQTKIKPECPQDSKDFSKVYVSLQAFKNQVYHGEFYHSNSGSTSKENTFKTLPPTENLSVLSFKDWEEKIINSREEKLLCLSDLTSFYQINPQALKKLQIQKIKISAWSLMKLALKQGHWKEDWKKIQANYMRHKL